MLNNSPEDLQIIENVGDIINETGLTFAIQEEVKEFRQRNPNVPFSGLMEAAYAYHEDGYGTLAEGLRDSCRRYDELRLNNSTIN